VNHSSILHGCRISYWRDGEHDSIAAETDTANLVHVCPIGKHYPEFRFELPEQRHDFDKLIHLMHAAASSGDYTARAEIRKALGL
jgi:hypothetical protein